MTVLGRTHRPVVNHELCQSCGVCLRRCPGEFSTDFRRDEGTVRGYLYRRTDLGRLEELPPCSAACPLGQRVRDYVGLIQKGRPMEALLTVLEDNPLPGVLGHVCHRPCEKACLRGSWDEPVGIRELKRYLAAYGSEHRGEVLEALKGRKASSNGWKVAIVGAGPAGLGCAFELLVAGCKVTVYDALPQPGGMLRVGIPTFRLPEEVVDRDVELLLELGMEFRGGVRLGKDIRLDELRRESDAVVLALGAWRDRRLGIPGEDAEGCFGCLEFLQGVREGRIRRLEGRVLVVGGGNAAVDSARTALRLGAEEVVILYRRRAEDMPADPEEVEAARREGVKVMPLVIPRGVLVEGGKVKGLELQRTSLGEPDASGRPRPVALEGTEFVEEGSALIVAIGQEADLRFFGGDGGRLELDERGQVCGYEGVFAAGDLVTGPSTVVEALASGQKVAKEVMGWLRR